jgi:hypothetical protein
VGARDLSIGDVADEDMPEGVFGLAAYRRPPLAPHEVLPRERVQSSLMVVIACDRLQGAGPEDLADNRRILEQRLFLARQTVEARGDHPLNRLGQGQVVCRSALDEQANVLLGVKRISAGPG